MNDKEKIERAVTLLTELIGVEKDKDEKHKQDALARGKSEEAVGESYDLFYLKMVRGILTGEE
jgi:hypothetical protein